MQSPPFLYKKQNNNIITGQFFKAFVKHGDHFVYEKLRVYADKTIAGMYITYNLPVERLYKHLSKFLPKIDKKNIKGMLGSGSDENMNAIPFEDFKYLVRKNLVTLNYKGLVKIEFWNENPITEDSYLINVDMNISKDDFIKMIEDVFCTLNDQPTTIRLFMNTLCEFLLAPKEKKEIFRKRLYKTYLNLPKYQRKDVYTPDISMKGKDPIGDILHKRKGKKDYYDEFVKEYDDIYFEEKYRKLGKKFQI